MILYSDLETQLKNSAFKKIDITPKTENKKFLKGWSDNIYGNV